MARRKGATPPDLINFGTYGEEMWSPADSTIAPRSLHAETKGTL
jgi:hypothetical protein